MCFFGSEKLGIKLSEGWEPFSVVWCPAGYSGMQVFMRREVPERLHEVTP